MLEGTDVQFFFKSVSFKTKSYTLLRNHLLFHIDNHNRHLRYDINQQTDQWRNILGSLSVCQLLFSLLIKVLWDHCSWSTAIPPRACGTQWLCSCCFSWLSPAGSRSFSWHHATLCNSSGDFCLTVVPSTKHKAVWPASLTAGSLAFEPPWQWKSKGGNRSCSPLQTCIKGAKAYCLIGSTHTMTCHSCCRDGCLLTSWSKTKQH